MKRQDYLDGKPFSYNDSESVVYKRVKTDSGYLLERRQWVDKESTYKLSTYKELSTDNHCVYFLASNNRGYFMEFNSCEVANDCLTKFGWCEVSAKD